LSCEGGAVLKEAGRAIKRAEGLDKVGLTKSAYLIGVLILLFYFLKKKKKEYIGS
jgi:hypothetical protein